MGGSGLVGGLGVWGEEGVGRVGRGCDRYTVQCNNLM